MQNITRFILTFFIAIPLVFGFGSQTVKQIDEIKNNTGTDILLNPTDKVDINYFTGEKALQSTVDGELEESAVTNTELSYVSGVTSSIQTQIDSKQPTLTGTDGDLYYWNSGLSNLAIGTNGQILQVSALGFPEWADLPPSVSVTTKGDLQTYSTAPDRLPVGTDGQVLQANSATSTGLEWIDPNFYTSPLTTQGDLLYRDATQDTRLGIGTEGQLLTVTSGEPAWQDAPVTLPSQTGNEGLYLTTNGTDASWNEINEDVNEIKNNFLECSGFDGCTQEGTITNGAGVDASSIVSRTTETTAFNPSKLNLSQTLAGTLDYTYTKTASFSNKQLVAYCEIKTSNTGVTFSAGADSVEAGSLEVSSDDSWKYYKIPLVGGATDQYFKIDHSDAGTIPDIDVDNCFIGKSPDTIKELGQASFVGSVTYKDNDCNWERSSATYGILVTPVLNTCFATEVIGNVIAPSPSDNPLITIPNFRTDGYYQIIHQGLKYNDGNSGTCYFNISKDANESNNSAIWVSANDGDGDNHLTADIRFNQGDTGNVQIIARNTGGVECSVRGQLEVSSSWSVYFFPDDNSTVVTQDTELTAKTANEFSAVISNTGVVSNENYDFINSCSANGTGDFTCTFNADIFDLAPNVSINMFDGSGTCREHRVSDASATSFRYQTLSSAGAVNDCQITVSASKQGTDVNKSATIVGKFENINSSDLCQVLAVDNDNDAISANTEDVPFKTVVYDNCNAWSNAGNTGSNANDAYTAQKDGLVKVVFSTLPNVNAVYTPYVNGVAYDVDIQRSQANVFNPSSIDILLSKSDVLTFRTNTTPTLTSSATRHFVQITELPDTESIIKNLSQQKTECQTKRLSADVTSTGAVADFQFNNLISGKKYRIYGAPECQESTATSEGSRGCILIFTHDSIEVAYAQHYITHTTSTAFRLRSMLSFDKTFTATASTLTASVQFIGSQLLRGLTNEPRESVTLCELPDTYVETNKF